MPTRIIKRPPQTGNVPLLISFLFLGLAVAVIFWYGGRLHDVETVAPSGEQLYNQHCAACHGNQGEGNPALNAPALDGTGTAWELTDGEIQRVIINGSETMPEFDQILTVPETADIIRYFQMRWTEEQLAAQQIFSQQDPLQP